VNLPKFTGVWEAKGANLSRRAGGGSGKCTSASLACVDAGSDCKFDIDGPSRFSHPKRMVPIVVDRTLNYSQVKVTAASESRGRGWNSGRPDRVESQWRGNKSLNFST
jgi:hypothetical protein